MLLYIHASEIDKEKGITKKNNCEIQDLSGRFCTLEEKKKATRKKNNTSK